MTKQQINNILTQDTSKSKKMVALYNGNLEIKEIAELMGVRYNFVYNVISNQCRIQGIELRTKQRASKKDEVIALIKDQKTNVEISAELRMSYTRVHAIRKEFEQSLVAAAK